jgi:hypothetical protein
MPIAGLDSRAAAAHPWSTGKYWKKYGLAAAQGRKRPRQVIVIALKPAVIP